jgi:hypothetical protein
MALIIEAAAFLHGHYSGVVQPVRAGDCQWLLRF